jgi:hypothetical protein
VPDDASFNIISGSKKRERMPNWQIMNIASEPGSIKKDKKAQRSFKGSTQGRY